MTGCWLSQGTADSGLTCTRVCRGCFTNTLWLLLLYQGVLLPAGQCGARGSFNEFVRWPSTASCKGDEFKWKKWIQQAKRWGLYCLSNPLYRSVFFALLCEFLVKSWEWSFCCVYYSFFPPFHPSVLIVRLISFGTDRTCLCEWKCVGVGTCLVSVCLV